MTYFFLSTYLEEGLVGKSNQDSCMRISSRNGMNRHGGPFVHFESMSWSYVAPLQFIRSARAQYLNEDLRTSNHKTCFSFALKYLQDLQIPLPFWYGWVENGLNGWNDQANCKSYRHFWAKMKLILWLGDLKASLRNSTEKFRYS